MHNGKSELPFVTLSELPPGKYVDVVARIVFVRTKDGFARQQDGVQWNLGRFNIQGSLCQSFSAHWTVQCK